MRGKQKLVLFTMVILSTEGLRPSKSTKEEFLSQTKDDYIYSLLQYLQCGPPGPLLIVGVCY